MEFEEKLEVCKTEMAKEFMISKKQAESLILWLNLEDLMIDRYEESIKKQENIKLSKWDCEIKLNPDLF